MAKKYKIAYIGYELLRNIFLKVAANLDLPDTEVVVMDNTLPGEIDDAIREARRQGVELFISSGANATEFRRRSSLPLVELRAQLIDYTVAVKKAMTIGNKVAVAYYHYTNIPNLRVVEELLDVEILHLVYHDSMELLDIVKNSQADVIIGGSAENEAARICEKKHILVYSGEAEVQRAITRARTVAKDLRRKMRDNSFLRFIVDYSASGIISVDSAGIVTQYNSAAADIMGVMPSDVLGKSIESIFPAGLLPESSMTESGYDVHYIKQNGNPLRMTRARVNIAGSYEGGIFLLEKIPEGSFPHEREDDPAVPAEDHGGEGFDDIIAHSPLMLRAISEGKLYSGQEEPVMIIGQDSVGKKLFAKCMHRHRRTQNARLIHVNCVVIPEKNALSYLFGREDPGGRVIGKGVLETAEQDTLVLENIRFAPPSAQRALLVALKEKSFTRVNGKSAIPFRCKVLSLVSEQGGKDLKNNLVPGLYYQLGALTIVLPPLKDRGEDIFAFFSRFMGKKSTFRNSTFEPPAPLKTILSSYSWPGNIQELMNVCLRFSLAIEEQHISTIARQRRVLIDTIGEDEICKDMIAGLGGLEALKKDPQKMLQAISKMKDMFSFSNDFIAAELGISRTTIWRMQKHSDLESDIPNLSQTL